MSDVCPLCKSQDISLRYPHLEDWEYRVAPSRKFGFAQCTTCSFWFMTPRPAEEEILSFYPSSYHAYESDRKGLTGYLVKIRQYLRRRYYLSLLPPGPQKAVFDVGCGDCRNFELFQKVEGIRLAGVEIHPDLADRGRQRGFEIYKGSADRFDETSLENQFDLVTMNHLLEHVADPMTVLWKTLRILKPGGVLAGELPCINSLEYSVFRSYWAGFHFPRHLQAFSQSTLKKALHEAGFDHVRILYPPHPVQWATSFQNALDRFVVRWPRHQAKGPFHTLFLMIGLGFSLFEKLFHISGIIGFEARKPLTR